MECAQSWQFNSSAVHLIDEIKSLVDESVENKWTIALKRKTCTKPEITEVIPPKVLRSNSCEQDKAPVKEEKSSKDEEHSEQVKQICDILETDLAAKIDFIIEEFVKNVYLFSLIPAKTSNSCVEKLCNQILDEKTVKNEIFLTYFFNTFLPIYLSQNHTWHSLDVVTKSFKMYPVEFKKHFLPNCLKNTKIPSNLLNDFVQALSLKDKDDFINILCNTNLCNEEFIHNLSVIHTLYKDSDKTAQVNSFILSLIEDNHLLCKNDKVFGKLLLTYLQNISHTSTDVNVLGNVVENHLSVFRRPCLTKFNGLK